MAERSYSEAPALGEGRRQQINDAMHQKFYAQMPREDYDRQMAGKSDLELANVAHSTIYADMDRADFNKQMGLTSASGSTQRAVTSGMTLGLQDEFGAAVGALPGLLTGEGYGAAYGRLRDAQRGNAEVFRQNNPYLGRGLEVAGGVATGAGAPGLALPSRARTIGNTATLGAVAGAGDAEGGVSDRLVGGGTGAALGAGMAALAPLVLRVGGGAVTRVARAAGLGSDEATASQLLLKAMQDDGLTPRDALARLTAWQRDGAKPETLFDVAGENTRRLARASAGRMGPGTQRAATFVAERQAGQAGRIADDATRTLGQSADDFHVQMRGLEDQRRSTAAPLYERAYAAPVPPEANAGVAPFVADRIGQEAMNKGLRVIELEHTAARQPFDPADYGVVRTPDGAGFQLDGPVQNMRLLDAVKRGYDDIVEGFRDPTSGKLVLDQHGRAVNSVRATYVAELRERFPVYGQALDAWGGPSQSMDAMGRGRNIFAMRDGEAAKAVRDALRNPGDADFFRLGASQAIQDRVANAPDGADAVKRIFGSPAKRALLRSSFPDDAAFRQFESAMTREGAMYRNGQFVLPTGSQTNMRGADADDVGGAVGSLAMAAVGIGGTSPGRAVGQFFLNRLAGAKGITPEVAEHLSVRMFNSSPQEVGAILQRLDSTQRQNVIRAYVSAQRQAAIWRGVTTGGAAAQ